MYLAWLCGLTLVTLTAENKEEKMVVPENPESAYVSTVIYYSPSEIKNTKILNPSNVKNPVVNTIIKK